MVAQRIGVFGGTFDPVHVGHVAAAATVCHALALDRVLMVVANRPWQKEGTRPITPAADRLAMVEAAVADCPGVEASAVEIERGGVSYTADTLAELTGAQPGAELFVVVGADVAAALPTWERAGEVAAAATLVVVGRGGVPTVLPEAPWKATFVEIPALELSSTGLRERAAAGAPLDGLVPQGAMHWIRQRGLYARERNA